jgi:tetratricopeptide (TPR) repeat protein
MSHPPKISNTKEPTQTQVATLTQKGIALHQQGNFAKAKVIYDQILVLQPNHFDALQLLGVLFGQVNKYSQALEFLSKALEINPNHAGANNNKGNVLKDLKRFEEALASYNQAIDIDSNHVGAQSNRGIVLKELKRFDEALASYDQAIKINPDYVDAYINRGNLLRDLKRFDEALASFDQAISINPNHAFAYSNRGNSLRDLKRFEEALASYEQAISINPNHAGTFCNRGIVLQGLQRADEALASYNRALEIDPDLITAHYNLSLFNLMKGNFKAGWLGYEWRWLDKDFDSEPLITNKPAWDFKKTNQRLLVWAEQGVGDQVSFGNLLSELSEDVPNLLVQIDKRLVPIFTRSLPKIKFFPDNLILPESDYDMHVPMGSLGKYLRNNEQEFLLGKNKFFISDQTRTQAIRQELSASKKLICGISWKSSAGATGINRSLSLEKLAAIFDPAKISLVNLQYGDTSKDIGLLKKNIELIQYKSIDTFSDLDGVASLIDACDFIVSVDNSIIHLSSALGKKTFVLLSYIPEWRILFNRDDSPWYPLAKLYKQERPGDWDVPLKKLETDLLNYITLVSKPE